MTAQDRKFKIISTCRWGDKMKIFIGVRKLFGILYNGFLAISNS